MLTLGATIFFTLSACDAGDLFSMPQDKETAPVNTTGNEQNEQTTDNKEEKEDVITLPQGLLQKGDQGNDIESLQKALNELDYDLEETSLYDDKTKLALEAQFESDNQVKPGDGLPLQKTTETDDGIEVTGNPYEVLVLVNKEHALPDDFTPDDLVIPNVRFPFTEDLPKKQ